MTVCFSGRRTHGPQRGSALRRHSRWSRCAHCPPGCECPRTLTQVTRCSLLPLTPPTPFISLPAPGPAEAWREADPARRPCWGEPDAGAVRQAGGRQHQNEALDGGDLCAFNRQRKAVVQVEVNSFFPPSLSLLLTAAKVKWCGWEQERGHTGLHCGCLLTLSCFFHTIPTSCTFPPSSLKLRGPKSGQQTNDV